MNLTAFRITKTKFSSSAFTGEGARLYGGRWNSVDTRIIYLASSLSGATLESLVHTDDYSTIEGLYSYIPVIIPVECVQSIDAELLPKNWDNLTPNTGTQIVGDKWVESMSSVVLEVPSVITKGELSFLVNPMHPDFSRLVIGETQSFKVDSRI